MSVDRDEPLDAELRALPTPDLDPLIGARAQRRARAVLARPGESTWTRAGLLFALDGALVPAMLILVGIVHAAFSLELMVRIFVG